MAETLDDQVQQEPTTVAPPAQLPVVTLPPRDEIASAIRNAGTAREQPMPLERAGQPPMLCRLRVETEEAGIIFGIADQHQRVRAGQGA